MVVCTHCRRACCSPVCGECRVRTAPQAAGRGCTESVRTQPSHLSPLAGFKEGRSNEETFGDRFSLSVTTEHLFLSPLEDEEAH